MSQFKIAPSILSADFAKLGEEVNSVLQAGADIIHFDVMDNHYVPNLTIGPMVCKSLRKFGIDAPIDVHLMVSPVDSMIEDFIEAGASMITFHYEASPHVDRSIDLINKAGCKSGIVLNPATDINVLEYVLDKIDMVLIMSVNPGFGGQSFIESSLKKIERLKSLIISRGLDVAIEVDGGINENNIRRVAEAGADIFVAGSAIFNSDNYKKSIDKMKEQLAHVSRIK